MGFGVHARGLLPVGIFAAAERGVFDHANRVHPIYFEFPSVKADDITISLPDGWQVSSLPKPLNNDARAIVYTMSAENDKNSLHIKRKLSMDIILIEQKFYPALRHFFQSVRSGMKSKWYYSPAHSMREIKPPSRLLQIAIVFLFCVPAALAGDAPAWMHSLVNAPLPAHDEKTDAVLMYSETNVAVISTDKIKTVVREAYKILRPGGRDYGWPSIPTNSNRRITALRGWCIPAQGKDYEIKDKEAVEVAVPKIEGSDLISDVKYKMLRIPASDPGNIVGYEFEVEERPLVLQDEWAFQESVPVRESHYSLQLPSGWEYKASFLNYPETKATQSGNGQWQWAVSDVKAVKKEEDMPPMQGLLGQMIISFFPPSGQTANGFSNWSQMGNWYRGITAGRLDASPEIKQKVASLTASDPSVVQEDQDPGPVCSKRHSLRGH